MPVALGPVLLAQELAVEIGPVTVHPRAPVGATELVVPVITAV